MRSLSCLLLILSLSAVACRTGIPDPDPGTSTDYFIREVSVTGQALENGRPLETSEPLSLYLWLHDDVREVTWDAILKLSTGAEGWSAGGADILPVWVYRENTVAKAALLVGEKAYPVELTMRPYDYIYCQSENDYPPYVRSCPQDLSMRVDVGQTPAMTLDEFFETLIENPDR